VNQPDSPQPAIEGPPHLPPPIRGGYRLISRPLLLGWCLWLLVSWAINLMLDGSAAMPAVRWMLVCALVGIMIAWPVWRLSLPTPPAPTLATLSDLLFLLLIFQVLVVRVGLDWPLEHAVLIDAAVGTWALATAMLVDLGRRMAAVGRTLAAIGCLALMVVPAAWIGPSRSAEAVALSPVRAMWVLADPRTMVDAGQIGWRLAVAAAAVVAVWCFTRWLVVRRVANPAQVT